MNKIRFVVVSHDSFWPLRGGGGVRVFWIVKKMLDRGHDVTVVAPFLSSKGFEETFPDIKIKNLGGISRFHKNKELIYSKIALQMLFHVAYEKGDIIYAHNVIAAFPALLVSKLRDIPIVFDMDDILMGLSSNKIISNYGPNLEYFVARHSDKIICMSNTLSNVLEKKGVSNIHCIPHGVDFNLFSPQKELKIGDMIIYIGGIESHDGVFLIPDAIKIVVNEFPDVKILIIGNGKDLPFVKQKVKLLGVEKNFEFKEWIDQVEIPKYLAKAKIGLVTHTKSLATDVSLVLKGLEYMAMELPVIAPDLRGMREEVGNSERGLLFKQGDYESLAEKIILLLRNPEQQKKMGENGINYVLKYCDWNKNAEEIVGVCEKCKKDITL